MYIYYMYVHVCTHVLCTFNYIHVCKYVCIVCMYMYMCMYYGWDNVCKTTFEASTKTNKYSKFAHVFINVALIILIVCRMHPKLDYYFITSTSLVPVTVSTYILHHCT